MKLILKKMLMSRIIEKKYNHFEHKSETKREGKSINYKSHNKKVRNIIMKNKLLFFTTN